MADIAQHVYLTKIPALVLSLIVFVVIMGYKEVLEKKVKKKISLPIPVDLIVIVVSTSVSYFLNLSQLYNITIMGEIPKG